MGKRPFKKWSSVGLSALLLGGSFLPNLAMHAKAAQFGNVVISEVYGGGGNVGAKYKNDFIELYNPTEKEISLDGWTVQYASASGTSYQLTKLTGSIKAHGYYLVQEGKGSGGTDDLPAPNIIGTMNMSGTAGKVALSKGITAITGKADANVIDFVGFGSANDFEGTGPTLAPSNTKSVERLANDSSDPTGEGAGNGNGWDTNDNAMNFVQADPNPQNSSSPQEPALTIPDPPVEGITYLGDVRDNTSDGQPKLLGQTVTVEGTVTVANNIVGSNSFYIQDDTGGMNVFGSTQEVTAGSKVKITGTVAFYRGLTEISPTSIEATGDGKTITPKEISKLAVFNTYNTAEPLEGTLVSMRGKVTNIPDASSGGGRNITLTDDAGKTVLVRVMDSTGVDAVNSFKVGSYYNITGIVGQYDSTTPYDSGYQVFPRNNSDINEYFALSLTHDPITTGYKGTDVNFMATATGADTVTVYYKETSASSYTSLPMVKNSQDQYKAVLPASTLPLSGFVYYIVAKNKSEVKTAGTADAPFSVKVELDSQGPEVTGFQPASNAIVETYTPDISFQINDPSGVDTSKLSVKLDGQDVGSTISDNQVQLQLINELTVGTHTVVVEAYDTKGNKSIISWSFTVAKPFTGGNHYRGTTHNHTQISHDAAGTPEDALKAGKAHGYDWFAFSDHSHDIDATLVDKDTVDHNGMPERKGGDNWQLTKDLAKQYTKDGDYVVFPAFEMTSTTWGHSNVFGTDNFIDRKMNGGKYQDLNQYYAWVLTYDNVAAQFNHPDMSANAFNNFMPYDQRVDKLFTMLEVGNGSGNYAYVNAEKKFFSALDLGWHIAPTFGEDNHDATWGQTLNRTVIVSSDLSQDSLLHSMRNMRVYMEEDPNFKLDVLANGQYMGAVVDSKSLKFDIKGSDPVAESNSMPQYNFLPSSYKSDDRIQKVELISNGSKVVDSIQPMTKDFTWSPAVEVTGGQQWFVVKVTQMDGEHIYSSPIWTKEQSVDVRVSGLDVTGDALISGNPATLQAGVSNLGITTLSNLNVKFYYDEVKDSNLIGTGTITQLASKGVATASTTWDSPIAGKHTLIAVVDTPQGDSPEDNQFNKEVIVKQSLGIKVMIDAAHKNENTSTDQGTYKNNFTAFTKLVKNEGYTVVENTKPLTADNLQDVKVLVLTHPQIDLTADENKSVTDFVRNGGSLLLTDKSNYKSDTTINNDLLQLMGSSIQINNDGINDDSKDGNFWSDPSKSPFSVRIHLQPVSNYITDRAGTLEYYSGSSLESIGHQPLTNSSSVTILASGNETTYQGSIALGNYVYDSISDDLGGSQIPAVASETIGNGKIIVSGMNFMNDKQLDESYNPKGNDELALNSVNWLAGRGTVVSNLNEARNQPDGTPVVVEGTVTTGAGIFYDAFYLQDDTGGIMAFHDVPEGSLKAGDKVRVYGTLKTFENNKELEYTDFAKDVIKLGSGGPISPLVITTGAANDEQNQGLLVKVTGKVKEKVDENSYLINDGSGDILVFTDGYIVTQSGPVPDLKIGDTLEAVGLTGKYAKGNRIRVRDTKELVRIKDMTAPVTTANLNPSEATGEDSWFTSNVTVNLTAQDDMSGVKLTQYKINDKEWAEYIGPIQLTTNGVFTVQYRSEDNEGNVENTKSVEVRIDKSAPVSAADLNPTSPTGKNGWYHSNVTVNLTSQDEISGVESIQYRINDQEWKEYATPIQLTNDGVYSIEYFSKDQAGNIETSKAIEVKIDKTNPVLKVKVDNPILPIPNHKLVEINATLEDNDSTSGIDSVILESITVNETNALSTDIQGADYGTLDTTFNLRSERNGYGDGRVYTITYLVTDQAGNMTRTTSTVTVPKGNSGK